MAAAIYSIFSDFSK